MTSAALTAITRFGLGPTPGLVSEIAADPRGYVAAQTQAPGAAMIARPYLRDRRQMAELFLDLHRPMRAWRQKERRGETLTAAEQAARDENLQRRRQVQSQIVFDEVTARFDHSVDTEHPLVERLALFWSNHFTVAATKNIVMRFLAGVFEREAVRPNVLGFFGDMLYDATTHPGMLQYLDNVQSVGPNSRRGRRLGNVSANENLAREVLELHTMGAGSGYTQGDVVALALTLTGWIGGLSMQPGNPIFKPEWHEGGARAILGKRYAAVGQDQLRQVLADLAVHPATAAHVSRKLAAHFVGGTPDPALTTALSRVFLESGGDLAAVTRTLLEHEAAWVPGPRKTVPPYDYMVAAVRALGRPRLPEGLVVRSARDLAQEVWGAPSPAGWPDDDDAFLGGDALLERVDFARHLSRRFADIRDVPAHARRLFGELLDPFVAEALDRAEDHRQAMVLLLMSPPFHRR